MMLAKQTVRIGAAKPALAPFRVASSAPRNVVRRFQEKDSQAQKEVQGGNAPKNPVTGERLQQVTNPQKEGYEAVEYTAKGNSSGSGGARITEQLGAQPEGRSFFGGWRRCVAWGGCDQRAPGMGLAPAAPSMRARIIQPASLLPPAPPAPASCCSPPGVALPPAAALQRCRPSTASALRSSTVVCPCSASQSPPSSS
jgi:hypothetical protein